MNEELARKVWETIAKILSQREGIEIVVTDIKRKEEQVY
jgi:hypothetical protein